MLFSLLSLSLSLSPSLPQSPQNSHLGSLCKCTQNKELLHQTKQITKEEEEGRSTRMVSFSLSNEEMRYETGDHVSVQPMNFVGEVESLAMIYGVGLGDLVQFVCCFVPREKVSCSFGLFFIYFLFMYYYQLFSIYFLFLNYSVFIYLLLLFIMGEVESLAMIYGVGLGDLVQFVCCFVPQEKVSCSFGLFFIIMYYSVIYYLVFISL